MKLNKQEMWEMFKRTQEEKLLLDTISQNLEKAVAKIDELESKNSSLQDSVSKMGDRIAVLEKVNEALQKSVVSVRRNQAQDNMYGRLENVEISGISPDVPDAELEDKVIAISKEIGVNIKARDISACHRLGRRGRQERDTIVRFVNRKNADKLFANSKKLKNKDLSTILGQNHKAIYINPNLSPHMKEMRWKLKKMKLAGVISGFGTSRRGVHVHEADEDGGFGKKVSIYVDEDLSTYLKEKSLSEVLDSNRV